MENKKIGKLNVLGSGIAFLIALYIGIIYILLMAGTKPGNIAYEITTGYASHWMFRFVVCIATYVFVIVSLVSIPAYFTLKAVDSKHKALGFARIAQFVGTVGLLICVILFWVAQGPIFIKALETPFATPYRIVELVLAIVAIAGVVLTTIYSPSSDIMLALKKKHNKKV